MNVNAQGWQLPDNQTPSDLVKPFVLPEDQPKQRHLSERSGFARWWGPEIFEFDYKSSVDGFLEKREKERAIQSD